MKLRILSAFLAFLLVFAMVPAVAATEVTEETTEATTPARGEFECGDDLVWSYGDGVLTIKGSGEMDDYEKDAPWAIYRDDIEKVVLEGVTYIGDRAFYDFDELETVDFGSKLKEIGEEAFRSCEGLEQISLPSSFKIFGESSFLGCTELEAIHCSGNFPSFRQNCMWECYATIYYPAERPWPVDLIRQLEEAFHGRIEFIASDGTDHYVPTEAVTEPETQAPETTEMPTEAPTEAVTEVPTEAPTEAVTEAPIQAPTEAETEPSVPTEAPADTEAPVRETEPVTPETVQLSNKAVILSMGIALALTMIVALLLVIRKATRKGKYTR